MSDILRINQAQTKILKTMIEAGGYEGSSASGVTGYDLSKLPRTRGIPNATWSDNYKKLEHDALIIKVKREKKQKGWRKKIKRKSLPFRVTTLGFFAVIKNDTKNENIKNYLDNLLVIVPNIALHFKELRDLYSESVLFHLLQISVQQIEIKSRFTKKPILPFPKKRIEEIISINFSTRPFQLQFSRTYNYLTKSEKEKNRRDVKRMNTDDVAFESLNYDELAVNIIGRLEFLFYYNLIKLNYDQNSRLAIFSEDHSIVVEEDPKLTEQNLEKYGKDFQIFEKRITKASTKIIELIQKDESLNLLFKNCIKEINWYFETPKILSHLTSKFQ